MRTKNPKAYWDYINSINSKTKHDDLKLNDFYAFFNLYLKSSLDDEGEHEAENFSNIHVQVSNNLNDNITEKEIINAIQQLKSGKACGADNVANEYLKHSINSLLPVYSKLFNVVFKRGVMPDSG